ncbi:DNA-binding transcriptional repressor ExuR [Listeria grayi]|uniref:GntR family transcriptional regulator n=1 Tax=Listeria grayi FSL F6-1183 TaxID=1265827 RepID=A0A829R8E0_LISGR|nr:GntR family transcriptional regulator [Listeria grayi]EUJ28997.1 GntR family transcriptional regulator [Listeria grayi FSL F6-1183]VEI35550.1 DNA-binding transcriptional repressor ExuR [Listeria grayi]
MNKQTYEKLAYMTIKEKILSGTYRIGDHVSESALAAELTISRTPVRRALEVLEADGLIRFERNRGAVVTTSVLTPAQFVQMLEMVEVLCLQTVDKIKKHYASFEPSENIRLTTELKAAGEKGDYSAYNSGLGAWLHQLLTFADNPYVQETLRKIVQDFQVKAKNDLKMLPLLLADRTVTAFHELIEELQAHRYEEAKNSIQKLINEFIILTFR